MAKTWRDSARPLIYEVIMANKGKDEKEIRKALRDAYPWGERRYHPYKIWCDEVSKQLRAYLRQGKPSKENKLPPNQNLLF